MKLPKPEKPTTKPVEETPKAPNEVIEEALAEFGEAEQAASDILASARMRLGERLEAYRGRIVMYKGELHTIVAGRHGGMSLRLAESKKLREARKLLASE